MKIGRREVGQGRPVFICAEMSCNHMGSLAKAHQLIDAAHEGGADAIKLQTYRPVELAKLRGDGMAPPPWEGRTLRDLYQDAQTPWEWHRELFDHANTLGMEAFSSTFSQEATAFLLGLGVPALKVSAFESGGEVMNAVAGATVPVIMSMRPDLVVPAVRQSMENLAVLHCPHGYPAKCADMKLGSALRELHSYTDVVGLSDHSVCPINPVMATTLGANIIEVHLMLHKEEYATSPLDALHSWNPFAFKAMVNAVRHTEASL